MCRKNITDDELKQYIGRGLNDFIDEVLEPATLKQRTELNQKIKENVLKDYGSKIRVIDTSPPASSKVWMFTGLPPEAALCSGVRPPSVCASMSAPAANKA